MSLAILFPSNIFYQACAALGESEPFIGAHTQPLSVL